MNCDPIYMDPFVDFCLVTRIRLSRHIPHICGAQAKGASGGLLTSSSANNQIQQQHELFNIAKCSLATIDVQTLRRQH